jgi:integrase
VGRRLRRADGTDRATGAGPGGAARAGPHPPAGRRRDRPVHPPARRRRDRPIPGAGRRGDGVGRRLLVYNGLRISEAPSRDVEHFTYQTGHRVLRLTRKGGKRSTEALAPVTVHALELYLAERTSGPIFLGRDGKARLSRSGAWRLIRRLARGAGIPAADQLSPHSLRHSFATGLLGAGVPLQDV